MWSICHGSRCSQGTRHRGSEGVWACSRGHAQLPHGQLPRCKPAPCCTHHHCDCHGDPPPHPTPPPPSHVVAHPLHTSCLITMPQGLSSPCLITMPSFCCSRFSVLVALAFVRHRPPLWDVVAVALQPVVCKGKCF